MNQLYGRLKLVTGPSIEPITLAEALVQCHAETGVEDSWFTSAIVAARAAAEAFQWRAYITQTWDLTFDSLPKMPLYIPRAPLISISSITLYDRDDDAMVYDEDIATSNPKMSTLFQIDSGTEPARIALKYNADWPSITLRSMSAVQIRFTAGYGATAATVPPLVKSAMLLHIAHFYENRAGEVPEVPMAFFNLLRPDKLYT